MNTAEKKIVGTSQYLNTKKTALVYGELCRQSNKNSEINFGARNVLTVGE